MSNILYSGSENAFYVKPYFSGEAPADSVQISRARYNQLINGQQNDIKITPGADGFPVGIHADMLPDTITERSRLNRSIADSADLHVASLGFTFPYKKADKESINEALSDALLLGLTDSDFINWQLVDGSWVSIKYSDLRSVAKAGAERRIKIRSLFCEWDIGAKHEIFNYIDMAGQ